MRKSKEFNLHVEIYETTGRNQSQTIDSLEGYVDNNNYRYKRIPVTTVLGKEVQVYHMENTKGIASDILTEKEIEGIK